MNTLLLQTTKLLVVLTIAFFALGYNATPASAEEILLDQSHPDLDQSQEFGNNAVPLNSPEAYLAQTFTVGKSGQFYKVDVKMSSFNCVAGDTKIVELVMLDGIGTPNGVIISTGQFVIPPGGLFHEWSTVTLGPVTVEAGDELGLRINFGPGGGCSYYWESSASNLYTDGSLWGGFYNGTGHDWINLPQYDSVFRTYVSDATPGTTDPGTDVEVIPEAVDENGDPIGESPISFTFDNVTGSGETTVTVSDAGTPPPSGFRIGNPPTYFNLETTATFEGAVEVCIDYTNTNYADETQLKLFHNGTGGWADITTSLDVTTNIICGSASSFSEFAIFEEKTLIELLAELRTKTQGINAKNGVANSLDGKLNAVQNAIEDANENNNAAAQNALEAYINTTESQASKGTITQDDANALIALAQEILSLL